MRPVGDMAGSGTEGFHSQTPSGRPHLSNSKNARGGWGGGGGASSSRCSERFPDLSFHRTGFPPWVLSRLLPVATTLSSPRTLRPRGRTASNPTVLPKSLPSRDVEPAAPRDHCPRAGRERGGFWTPENNTSTAVLRLGLLLPQPPLLLSASPPSFHVERAGRRRRLQCNTLSVLGPRGLECARACV